MLILPENTVSVDEPKEGTALILFKNLYGVVITQHEDKEFIATTFDSRVKNIGDSYKGTADIISNLMKDISEAKVDGMEPQGT